MDNNDSTKPQQTGGLKLMTVFIAVLALHVLVIGGFTVYHLMGSGGSDADLTLDKTHKLKADGTVVTDTSATDTATPDKTADTTASTDTATTVSAPSTTGTTTAPAATAPTGTSTPAATQVAASTSTVTPSAENPSVTPVPSAAPSPIVLSGDDMAQTSTIPPGLAPPPEPTLSPNGSAAGMSPTPSAPAPEPSSAMTSSTLAAHAATNTTAKSSLALAPAPEKVSSATPSGPVIPKSEVASGPVHMPANPPAPASGEEHVSAQSHEEHAVAFTHEAKKEVYTVKMTDSYKKIAQAHHITVAELKAANHIKGDTLHTGQKLVIPGGKTSVAKSGATHDETASMTASTAVLSASPASSAKTHHHYYTVAKGDTLKKIAKKFNVTASALEEANNLSGAKVAMGEKLKIPSHEVRTTAGTSTPSPSLTDRVAAPMAAPAPIQPRQVETQPTPVEQPAPTPVATPSPVPQPTPSSSPELTSLNF